MQINFTGTKNIGYYYDISEIDTERFQSHGSLDYKTLNIELLDDRKGHDYTDFQYAKEHSMLRNSNNEIQNNFLNITIRKSTLEKDEPFQLWINDTIVEIRDENLKLISYIAKLLKEISKKAPSELIVDSSYLEGSKVANALILGCNLRDDYESLSDYLKAIKKIHSPRTVQQGAKNMFEDLSDRMLDYFS